MQSIKRSSSAYSATGAGHHAETSKKKWKSGGVVGAWPLISDQKLTFPHADFPQWGPGSSSLTITEPNWCAVLSSGG